MTNKNDSARRDKFQALRLAEIQATDAEDMELCVRDMQSFASLSEVQARVVAAAVRSKHLPSLARQAGLSGTVLAQFDDPRENAMPMKTNSFAKEMPSPKSPSTHGDYGDDDTSEDDMDDNMDNLHNEESDEDSMPPSRSRGPVMDDEMGHGTKPFKNDSHSDDDMDDMGAGMGDEDLSEGKDGTNDPKGDMATIQIEVPADKIDDSKMQQMQEFMEQLFGGKNSPEDSDDDPEMSHGSEMDDDSEMGDEDSHGGLPPMKGGKSSLGDKEASRNRRLKIAQHAARRGYEHMTPDQFDEPTDAYNFDHLSPKHQAEYAKYKDYSGDDFWGAGYSNFGQGVDWMEDHHKLGPKGVADKYGLDYYPEDHEAEPVTDMPHTTATRKVNTMTKEAAALAARARERKAILAQARGTRFASEENGSKPRDINLGKDTSEGTYGGEKPSSFQYADAAQYKGEDRFPTMTMNNSEGNSLRDQNPTFGKTRVPTMNPDNLQLGDSYEVVKKEGSGDGSLEYTVDFAKVDFIPSSDPARDGNFELPTQMPETAKRKTTVARRITCQGCNNPRLAEVFAADCQDCGTRVAICQDCANDEHCPVCAASASQRQAGSPEITINADEEMMDEGETDDGETSRGKGRFEGTEMPQKDRDTKKHFTGSKEAELFRARMKTAFSVSTRLALAGVIHSSEVDGNVEMWMDGGLSAQTMLTQGSIMLRSAQSASERVAAAGAEKINVRTASSHIGLSTNPAFSVSTGNSAPLDLQTALKGLFSMPRIED